MDRFSKLLERIAVMKVTHADTSLRTPKEPTSFEYGKASGVYLGYCQVEQVMNDILKEDENAKRS